MVSGSLGGKERESGFRVVRREREREWFQGRQEGKRERVVSGSLGGKERESGFRVVRREREREWFQGR